MESFAEFMDRCLYHRETGYYGSGKVRFGEDDHFWTYPMNLSPVFGWLMAERIRSILDCWAGEDLLPAQGPITILELGSGNGFLARDLLDHLDAQPDGSPWAPYLGRIRYVGGELSDPLRKVQEGLLASHIEAGRARVVEMDARSLDWEGPFVGVVLANELLDALPCERLRISGPDPEVQRLLLAPGARGEEGALEEVWVPVEEGRKGGEGASDTAPSRELLDYLAATSLLLSDLDSCGLLPVDLFWPPSLPSLVSGLGEFLTGPGSLGAAILVDYGGTTRHILDPRSREPHLRSYGKRGSGETVEEILLSRGDVDLTCDVDFTEVARLAMRVGLEVKAYGHQSDLEGPFPGIDSVEALEAIAEALTRNVGLAPGVARMVAPVATRRFRRAPCFWMMALAPTATPFPDPAGATGLPHPSSSKALSTLASEILGPQLLQALEGEGIPGEVASCLKPCGEIAADLSEGGFLDSVEGVLSLLEERGWLTPPGGLSRRG